MEPTSSVPQRAYIELRGGVLVAAYSDAPGFELNVLDWDDAAKSERADVQAVPIAPTAEMPDETRLQFFPLKPTFG